MALTNKEAITRTCRETGKDPVALESYRDRHAYVLLGDSGMGKTTAFKKEAEAVGGKYITARNFTTLDLADEDLDKILFIDGLDEIRIGHTNLQLPLDQIRQRLQNNKFGFRLSCREADWLGDNDHAALKDVCVGKEVLVLHLDPLTEKNIEDILKHEKSVSDLVHFINKAHEHNLSTLLCNPQTLNFLVKAVSENSGWPSSRKEIYELACKKLVIEKNSEHGHNPNKQPVDQLLNASGCLCAIQLLSGITGFAFDDSAVDAEHFNVHELSTEYSPELLREALKRNLFERDMEEQRVPIHRSVSEYLAARSLAMLINKPKEPLLFDRVLALMPEMVSDLRGLSAWLAVHCGSGSLRNILIERDPFGVVMYGDVRDFSDIEKQLILKAFKKKSYDDEVYLKRPSLGALATENMIPAFRKILSMPSREEIDQKLLSIVLVAIAYSDPVLNFADEAEIIVRDPSYWPSVRTNAIQVLAHDPSNNEKLLELAEGIRSGNIEDRDDQVLGELLCKLYPNIITPFQILNYFHQRKALNFFGSYSRFWNHDILNTKVEDLPNLLDQLVSKCAELRKLNLVNNVADWVGKLLVKGVEAHGEKLNAERLYGWLGLGIDEHGNQFLQQEDSRHLAKWFENYPDKYKAMIKQSASIDPQKNFNLCVWRLQRAFPPSDIEPWCLENAKREALEKHNQLAQYYLYFAISFINSKQQLNAEKEEFLEAELKGYSLLQEYLKKIIANMRDIDNHLKAHEEKKVEQQKEKIERIKFYLDNIYQIQNGTAAPGIMHVLAAAYNGGYYYEIHGDTPEERMKDLLGDDQELINAAYLGFRHVLNRDDLPTVSEIIKFDSEGKYHSIRLPCLVGIAECYKNDSSSLLNFSDTLLSQLLAFYFTADLGEAEPHWVTDLVSKKPLLVEKILLKYVLAMLKKQKDYISPLFRLIDKKEYKEISSAILPGLLKKFPLRASKQFLQNVLQLLLRGAVASLDKKILASIIRNKLKLKSLDDAQRIYWLTCGFMVKPELYTSKLQEYIGDSQARKRDLGNFLKNCGNKFLYINLNEKALSFLIEILAPECLPYSFIESDVVTAEMQTAELVRALIYKLSDGSNKKCNELEHLLNLESLVHWRNFLEKALYMGRVRLSSVSFSYPDVAQVCHTLENKEPANAADLFALTISILEDIARNIRDGNTNNYKQYWSYDSNNKELEKSKPENDCRDAFLSDLECRLKKFFIDAKGEVSYADNKRADIMVSFKDFNIPIEIKKDANRHLLPALQEQLIKKYVRDPGTGGFGIYLIFWFGDKKSIGRTKIESAKQLQSKLQAMLTQEVRQRIHVCVVDVSRHY